MAELRLRSLGFAPRPASASPLEGRGGFALTIALGLMGFILLLVVSMTGLLRVETRLAENRLQSLKARQKALAGLHVAFGRLQASVGPDRRVTARADLFDARSNGFAEPRWIGVWPANPVRGAGAPADRPVFDTEDQRQWDNSGATQKLQRSRTWLVSGPRGAGSPALDPREGPRANEELAPIVMRRDASGDPVATAGRETIGRDGSFAYWVDDESQKARVDLADPHRGDSDPGTAGYAARLAQRYAPEAVLDGNNADGFSDLPRARLERLGQMELLGLSTPNAHAFFTASAATVLANTREGGLKKDLTAVARMPPTELDDGVTADASELPEGLQEDPFLYTIDDLSRETLDGDVPSNPNVGSLDQPIRGPRIESLWDFANLDRLIQGGAMEAHEPVMADWLGYVSGSLSRGDDDFKAEARKALLQFQPFDYGDEREIDMFPPAEAMALGEQLDFGASPRDSDVLRPRRHLPVNSPVTPVTTELIFYVRVDVTGTPGDYELTLRVHPFLEMTNPYDTAIRLDHPYWHPVFEMRLAFDFRLRSNDDNIEDRVWSRENDTGRKPLAQLNARALGSLVTGEIQNDPSVGLNAQVTLQIPSGTTFEPGETLGFVASGSGVGRNVEMVEGSRWREASLAAPIRSWSFNGGEVEYGDPWPDFSPAESSGPENGLDDFDEIEVRVSALPMARQGPRVIPLDWHTHGGSQVSDAGPGAVRLDYQSFRVPFSRRRIGENSEVGFNTDLGDAFAADVSFPKTASTWENTAPQDAGVLQLRALSARDFQDGNFAVEGFNAGTATFLGRSNPRAMAVHDAHGYGGDRAFETTGWTTGFHPDPIGFGLSSEPGWGASNLKEDPTILFHAPRREPVSVGALRHWNAGWAPGDPAYPVGGSKPSQSALQGNETVAFERHTPDYQVENRDEFDFSGEELPDGVTLRRSDFAIDSSYYLNRAIWNDYFFSTVPAGSSPLGATWPNSRFRVVNPDEPDALETLRDYREAAGKLLLRGGFNVNSTSEKAWAAVLASRLGLDMDGREGAAEQLFYPRMPGMDAGEDPWTEASPVPLEAIYRPGQKADQSARTVSKRIVKEVRERGPFLSLAHFVNRLLVPSLDDPDDDRGDMGALQAALEASEINEGVDFEHAPGAVTQADVLGALGPMLTARGDTFVIRAMAENSNPAAPGRGARAWCEAVVQRMPAYVDPADAPETPPDDLQSAVNRHFGRDLRIVDFRWIDPPTNGTTP